MYANKMLSCNSSVLGFHAEYEYIRLNTLIFQRYVIRYANHARGMPAQNMS